jgi:hypothetical protein
MFHVAMWRERMRDSLKAAAQGAEFQLSGTRDEINDMELPNGIGTPLSDAAARSEQLLSEITELLDAVGGRPIQWLAKVDSTDAVLRNSYSHPRRHMCEYLAENGDVASARKLLEDALSELHQASVSDYVTSTLTELREDVRFKADAAS